MATLAPSAPSSHSKPCSHCGALRDVLVRCQIDESRAWVFICPGRCWRELSGGEIDGDDEHPHYRYGGMWKNKHDAVSAKKKKKTQRDRPREWRSSDHGDATQDGAADKKKYTRNDRVTWDGKLWTCRKTHFAQEANTPDKEVGLWKEEGPVSAD
ncbi:hypothetical protein BFW01_g9121 [Lasiodiplodia theobromae]|uniref:Chitin-binding type-3 domain-containing protein n=1 Tax=Lasiodiplodia theobromae TaxID=45133 RepID=A0A5N5DH14_9PEZI|nr:hypothetical protein DBV05_g5129 [Lasiodiplodia theobromae]KAF9638224.1 hypothetical protein BFW01_g9121 [Lasiodiplodia theobromae]